MKLYAKLNKIAENYGLNRPDDDLNERKLYTEEEIKKIQLKDKEFFYELECDESIKDNNVLYLEAGYDYDRDDGESFWYGNRLYSEEEVKKIKEESERTKYSGNFYEYVNQREIEKVNTIDIAKLGAEIGMEAKEQTLPNGKVVNQLVWDQENLLKAVNAIKHLSEEGKPVRITGIAPAWLVSALTHTVHPCPVSLYQPAAGKDIDIPQLAHGEANPEGEVAFKTTEKGDAVLVEYNMDLPDGITTYDENNLSKVVVPEIAQGKAVYLSGRGPNYLTVAIAEAYAHTNSSVSLFQPGVGYTCSITHSRNKRLGDLTKDPLGKEEVKEQLSASKESATQEQSQNKDVETR